MNNNDPVFPDPHGTKEGLTKHELFVLALTCTMLSSEGGYDISHAVNTAIETANVLTKKL